MNECFDKLSTSDDFRMIDVLFMKYFVLKPLGGDIFAKASREAMKRYAEVVRDEYPVFSEQLTRWTDKLAANEWAIYDDGAR